MQDCFYFSVESPGFLKAPWESHFLQSARVLNCGIFFELGIWWWWSPQTDNPVKANTVGF